MPLPCLPERLDGVPYFLPFFFAGSTCATLMVFAATALRITTMAFGPPGTEPSTRSRLFSGSTRSTLRFLVVTPAAPMWPPMRIPFTTRDGYEEAPIDPGARWNIEPCDIRPPLQ